MLDLAILPLGDFWKKPVQLVRLLEKYLVKLTKRVKNLPTLFSIVPDVTTIFAEDETGLSGLGNNTIRKANVVVGID